MKNLGSFPSHFLGLCLPFFFSTLRGVRLIYVMIMICNSIHKYMGPTSNIVDSRSLDIEPQGVGCELLKLG